MRLMIPLLIFLIGLTTAAVALPEEDFFNAEPGMNEAQLLRILGDPVEREGNTWCWPLEGESGFDLGLIELEDGHAAVIVLNTPVDGPDMGVLTAAFRDDLGTPAETGPGIVLFLYETGEGDESCLVIQGPDVADEGGATVLRMARRRYEQWSGSARKMLTAAEAAALRPGMSLRGLTERHGPAVQRGEGEYVYSLGPGFRFLEAILLADGDRVVAVTLVCAPGQATVDSIVQARLARGALLVSDEGEDAVLQVGAGTETEEFVVVQSPPDSGRTGPLLIRVGPDQLEEFRSAE